MAGYTQQVLPKMVAPHNIEALPTVATHVLDMMRNTPAEGAAAALRGRAERPDYLDLLARITVPTLIVVGSDDEYTPISDAQLMHDHIPNSTLTIIDGAAHLPNLERPAEFNTALRHFLDLPVGASRRHRLNSRSWPTRRLSRGSRPARDRVRSARTPPVGACWGGRCA